MGRHEHASSGVLRHRVTGGKEACFLIDAVQPLTQSGGQNHACRIQVDTPLIPTRSESDALCLDLIDGFLLVCVCVCVLFFSRQCGKPSAAGAGAFGRFASRAESGDWKTPDSQLGGHPGSSWCSHRQSQRSVEAGRSHHKALFSAFIAEEPVKVWFEFCFQQ